MIVRYLRVSDREEFVWDGCDVEFVYVCVFFIEFVEGEVGSCYCWFVIYVCIEFFDVKLIILLLND